MSFLFQVSGHVESMWAVLNICYFPCLESLKLNVTPGSKTLPKVTFHWEAQIGKDHVILFKISHFIQDQTDTQRLNDLSMVTQFSSQKYHPVGHVLTLQF